MTTFTLSCKNFRCRFAWAVSIPGKIAPYCPRCGYSMPNELATGLWTGGQRMVPHSQEPPNIYTATGIELEYLASLVLSAGRKPGESDAGLRARCLSNLNAVANLSRNDKMDNKTRDLLKYSLRTTLIACGALINVNGVWAFYLPNVMKLSNVSSTTNQIGGAEFSGNVSPGWSGTQGALSTNVVTAIQSLSSIQPGQTFPSEDAAVDYYLTVIDRAYAKATAAA